MRNAMALAMVVSLATLPALPALAHPAATPAAEAVLLDDAAASAMERALAMLAQVDPRFADSAKASFAVPAGHALVARVVDGAWVVGVAPAAPWAPPPSTTSGTDGAGECKNDDPAREYSPGSTVPTTHPMNANPLWPLTRNVASEGSCGAQEHQFSATITYFQFSTAGNYGGAVSLIGWDFLHAGTFSVACAPSGVRVAAGVAGEWPDAGFVEDAWCHTSQYGLKPSAYLAWKGSVTNYNSVRGMSTHAIAY